jgi:hypothetical protein
MEKKWVRDTWIILPTEPYQQINTWRLRWLTEQLRSTSCPFQVCCLTTLSFAKITHQWRMNKTRTCSMSGMILTGKQNYTEKNLSCHSWCLEHPPDIQSNNFKLCLGHNSMYSTLEFFPNRGYHMLAYRRTGRPSNYLNTYLLYICLPTCLPAYPPDLVPPNRHQLPT